MKTITYMEKIEKVSLLDTTHFSLPTSFVSQTNEYQLSSSLIGKSISSATSTDLLLGKIDSNIQLDATSLKPQQWASFSNAEIMPNILEETRVKDKSEVKEKKLVPLDRIQHDYSSIEWVRLTPNKIIMATPNRVWVYRPKSEESSNFFARPSDNAGSVVTTKKLLDTAIVLGKRAANSRQKTPALNPVTWVWSLASQYHLTHFTPQLMEEASQYFSNQGREQLAEWAAEKAIEESGHDRLALLDIQSLGYDAEAVVKAFVPPSATVLLDYFIDSVQTSDPIKCVGYSYTLERLALAIGKEHIQAVEAQMPLDTKATRCLRVHSSIGSDVEHVEEIIELVAKLTPKERTQIAIACYQTALLYFSSHENDYPSEEQLQQKLKAFQLYLLQSKARKI